MIFEQILKMLQILQILHIGRSTARIELAVS